MTEQFITHHVHLSRRNLLTLLNKLDYVKEGGTSHCTLIKDDNKHPTFPQSCDRILVTAHEDEDYYIDRAPGFTLNAPEPKQPEEV